MVTENDLEALDFSKDSRIKNTLLEQIKYNCFAELEDDALDCLNAAGERWLNGCEKKE